MAHKPSSNGLVERTNKKIIELLRKLVTPKTINWDLCLDDIQLTINNTVNSSTGETPHFILYGVERHMHYSIIDDAIQPKANYNETSSRSPCMRPRSDPPKVKNSTPDKIVAEKKNK